MRNISKIIWSVSLFSLTATSENYLFMNAEESEQAFNAVKQKGTNKESNSEKHRVSGIFYVNEDNWTVWIDNVPYSSTGQKGDFSIEAVTEKTATLTTQNGSIIELSVEQGDDESNKNDKEKNCE